MNSKKLDQFYTKKHIAVNCYKRTALIVDENNTVFDSWLEPSAGTGAFYELLPSNKIGVDLDPKFEGVILHDFLTYNLEDKKFIAIGNPPFGKNSSLAIKFFNKCAEQSVLIAFIVPKTFKKLSTLRQLNPFFLLIYEEDIPPFSFEFNEKDYDVPCVFQIWKKNENRREKIEFLKTHSDFSFVTKDAADFAIQRVGVNAGKVKSDFHACAPPSHYFIKADDLTKTVFENINWDSVKFNTAGNPSISKHELIVLYENFITN